MHKSVSDDCIETGYSLRMLGMQHSELKQWFEEKEKEWFKITQEYKEDLEDSSQSSEILMPSENMLLH